MNDFVSAKPYVSLRVTTAGGTATTINAQNAQVIGTVGTTSLSCFCYNATVSVAHGIVGDANVFMYTFIWTGAHPLGTNYVVGA